MKILRVKLHGYKGIYNGMNELKTLDIDLTGNVNKIIMIKGDNGSGKSTLFNALHMYPDSSSALMEENCYKELVYQEGRNIYYIRIDYPFNNGKRQTTKAYISRADINTPNNKVQLNTNGNVTSYCNKIEELFQIDKDFMSLSHLGVEDRGLVDKTPADRKRFISNMLSDLDIFKDIYKIATSKLSGQGERIRTISQTLDKLSNGKPLIELQNDIERECTNITNRKISILSRLDTIKSKIESCNDNENFEYMTNLNNSIMDKEALVKNHEHLLANIRKSMHILFIPDEKHIKSTISSCEFDINHSTNMINELDKSMYKFRVDKDVLLKKLSDKTERHKILSDGNEYDQCKYILEEINTKIGLLEPILDKLGIVNTNNFTTDMYIIALNALEECQTVFNTIQSLCEYSTLEKAVNMFTKDYNSMIDVSSIDNKFAKLSGELDETLKTLEDLVKKKESLNILNKRPKECKHDHCKFISEYVNINPVELDKLINEITIKSEKLTDAVNKCSDEMKEAVDINNILINIRRFSKLVKTNSKVLSKLKIKSSLYHETKFMNDLLSGYAFNEYDELYANMNRVNVIDEYNDLLAQKEVYTRKFKEYTDTIEEINSLSEEIAKLKVGIANINSSMTNCKEHIEEHRKKLDANNKLHAILIKYHDVMREKVDIEKELKLLKAEYDGLISANKELHDMIDEAKVLNVELLQVEDELKAKDAERQDVYHKMKLYEHYNQQLGELKNKYDKLELIKKASSVSTGIPVVYMSAYMSRILSKANMLLKYLFDGEFQLDNFIINEKEFNIPCIGGSLRHNDISTMSTSQKCMLSLVVSFAILSEVSPIYNIIKLDEIDGGLDNINRSSFVVTLYKLIDLLNAEQVFIISHNNEMNIDECDMILLRSAQTYNAQNVLYNYNDM